MSECIEATTGRSPNGYAKGNVNIGTRSYSILQHRMAWELEHGPIPQGLFVLHTCDNRACVNVTHLFLGTTKDNMQDMVTKGRHPRQGKYKTHCPAGHEYTEENVYTSPQGAKNCRKCMYWRSALFIRKEKRRSA